MIKTGGREKMATASNMAEEGEAVSAGAGGMVCSFGIILFFVAEDL